MTDREVMQVALEALDGFAYHGRSEIWTEAVTALRARLADPEPEPVAWADWWRDHGQYNFHATSQMTFERAKELMKLAFEVGRETTPPTRRPLTDEEIDKLPWGPSEGNPMTFAEGLRDFARAVERAHGIKEQS